jgi:hypothetical protein
MGKIKLFTCSIKIFMKTPFFLLSIRIDRKMTTAAIYVPTAGGPLTRH